MSCSSSLVFANWGEKKMKKTPFSCHSWNSGINHYCLRKTYLFLNQHIWALPARDV